MSSMILSNYKSTRNETKSIQLEGDLNIVIDSTKWLDHYASNMINIIEDI